MRNFSDIKHRIASVSDTRKITGAMETISVAKMRKALVRSDNNRKYFETIRTAINDIALYTREVAHKVFADSKFEKPAYIVIASDKGLAGGFNHAVLEFASAEIANHANAFVYVVGRMTAEYFSSRHVGIEEEFADASFDPSLSQAAEMSERLYSLFEGGEIDCAYIVYTAFDGHGKMHPEQLRLLPFDRSGVLRDSELSDEKKHIMQELVYEPSAEEVLKMLIPQYLTGMVYGALIQSSACEHSQRQGAMHSATKNASEILEELKKEYNRARQESVTDELSEIVTAANGVADEK